MLSCFSLSSLFSFFCHGTHRYLHSFPTRRSSDLRSPSSSKSESSVDPTSSSWLVSAFHPSSRQVELGLWCLLSAAGGWTDRKSTRQNSSHLVISYAVFCLKKKIQNQVVQQVFCR